MFLILVFLTFKLVIFKSNNMNSHFHLRPLHYVLPSMLYIYPVIILQLGLFPLHTQRYGGLHLGTRMFPEDGLIEMMSFGFSVCVKHSLLILILIP